MNALTNKMTISKHQLLDPITTMANIIMLNFMPLGTKISIRNNKINIVTNDQLQAAKRLYYGDSRKDLSFLYSVIEQFISLYLVANKSNNRLITDSLITFNTSSCIPVSSRENYYEKLCKLATYLCKGLKRLQETYFYINNKQQDTTTFTLQYFINTINDALDEKYDHDNKSRKPSHNSCENINVDNDILIWSSDDLEDIYKRFYNCFDEHDEPIKNKQMLDDNLNIIRAIIDLMDKKFLERVEKV